VFATVDVDALLLSKGAEKNVKFYEKLGFVRKELQMACYF